MNEENQRQPEVQTPDFTGEEMKMPENMDVPQVEKESSSVVNGPLLAVLAILLLLILGGMYYWFSVMTVSQTEPVPLPAVERPTPEENNEPESTTAEAQVDAMETVSTSDELSAIEADVEATDLDSIDAELNAIDAELEAAIQ